MTISGSKLRATFAAVGLSLLSGCASYNSITSSDGTPRPPSDTTTVDLLTLSSNGKLLRGTSCVDGYVIERNSPPKYNLPPKYLSCEPTKLDSIYTFTKIEALPEGYTCATTHQVYDASQKPTDVSCTLAKTQIRRNIEKKECIGGLFGAFSELVVGSSCEGDKTVQTPDGYRLTSGALPSNGPSPLSNLVGLLIGPYGYGTSYSTYALAHPVIVPGTEYSVPGGECGTVSYGYSTAGVRCFSKLPKAQPAASPN